MGKQKAKLRPPGEWKYDPATPKQIAYLESTGFACQPGMTKNEAHTLISNRPFEPNITWQPERKLRAKELWEEFKEMYYGSKMDQIKKGLTLTQSKAVVEWLDANRPGWEKDHWNDNALYNYFIPAIGEVFPKMIIQGEDLGEIRKPSDSNVNYQTTKIALNNPPFYNSPMAQKMTSEFCRVCGSQKMFVAEKASHILHLLLTLVTGGLWLFIWIPLMLKPLKYRCSGCGSESGTRAPAQEEPTPTRSLGTLILIACIPFLVVGAIIAALSLSTRF